MSISTLFVPNYYDLYCETIQPDNIKDITDFNDCNTNNYDIIKYSHNNPNYYSKFYGIFNFESRIYVPSYFIKNSFINVMII